MRLRVDTPGDDGNAVLSTRQAGVWIDGEQRFDVQAVTIDFSEKYVTATVKFVVEAVTVEVAP